MKLALMADIHSNLEAFTACLDHAKRQGKHSYAFLGDLVGYGADPGPVVDLVLRCIEEEGGILVKGNHDAAVVRARTETMNTDAEVAAVWTRDQLTERQLQFLGSLPLTARRHDSFFVHASAQDPSDWIYITDHVRAYHSMLAARANWLFCGHIHRSELYYMGQTLRPVPFTPVAETAIPVHPRRQWLGVIGAVGQPRDGVSDACYAVMDFSAYTLTYHRVPYDWQHAATKIRAAGLPERLASRLGRGE